MKHLTFSATGFFGPLALLRAVTVVLLLTCHLSLEAAKGGNSGGGGSAPGNPAIVYVGDGYLKMMDVDGANQTLVLRVKSSSNIATPVWHPNGQQIFFSYRSSQGRGWGLYRINIDGSGLTEIFTPPASSPGFFMGDVSPVANASDQHLIAFIYKRNEEDGFTHNRIFIANEDGTGASEIIGLEASAVSWSPDGQWLAYSDSLDGGLYLMHLSGDGAGGIAVVENTLLLDREAVGWIGSICFARTGDKIYLSAQKPAERRDLWALLMEASLSTVRLTATANINEWTISSSADDSKIASGAAYSDPDGTYHEVIVVANSDGSNPQEMPRPVIDKSGNLENQKMPSLKR